MGRGLTFSPLEEMIILENYDRTIADLEKLLLDAGYRRSRKSINRKLEKLREEGRIGFRSQETIKRSYRQRSRGRKETLSKVDKEVDPWDSGEIGFDTGIGWEDDVES